MQYIHICHTYLHPGLCRVVGLVYCYVPVYLADVEHKVGLGSATTAGEDGPDGAQKAPASSSAATATPKWEGISGVGSGCGRSEGGGGKGSRKEEPVVGRTPVQNPLIQSAATATEKDDGGALAEQEKAFLLVWPGLGLLILVEGIVLAARGFFPEEWDNLFVKYFYPFTPTVVLFLGGTVAYGVFKYLKARQSKS